MAIAARSVRVRMGQFTTANETRSDPSPCSSSSVQPHSRDGSAPIGMIRVPELMEVKHLTVYITWETLFDLALDGCIRPTRSQAGMTAVPGFKSVRWKVRGG